MGFDPRTVQPVVSRYTDCAIPAHLYHYGIIIYSFVCKYISGILCLYSIVIPPPHWHGAVLGCKSVIFEIFIVIAILDLVTM